jgi:prepilin-type N-terminal cleavage/methylation domain-containing protein
MKPARQPGGGRRAFTLIEMMLAIAIFAGVLAAIYSSWMGIVRGSRTALAAAEEAQRRRIAVQAIEESLACAKMFPASPGYYGFVADTETSLAALSFVARLPASFPQSGRFVDLPMRRVTFSTAPDPEGGAMLELRQVPILFSGFDSEMGEDLQPLVVLRGVEVFLLQFWGATSKDWEDKWLTTNQLPRMVRFTIATAPTGGRGQPRNVITRVVALPGGAVSGVISPAPVGPQPGQTNVPPPTGQQPSPTRR